MGRMLQQPRDIDDFFEVQLSLNCQSFIRLRTGEHRLKGNSVKDY